VPPPNTVDHQDRSQRAAGPPRRAGPNVPNRTPALPLLGAAAGTALPPAALALADPPWLALLLACLPGIGAGAVGLILNAVIPQESTDRLAWWQALLSHRGARVAPVPRSRAEGSPGQPIVRRIWFRGED